MHEYKAKGTETVIYVSFMENAKRCSNSNC